jgi:hypothetical protein
MSSLRWREALLFSVLGAFCGYVFAQLDKGVDHSAVLAQCKVQEQTPERIELCMRAAGYEFSDTDCKGAEIVFEQQRLANAAEIIKARRGVLNLSSINICRNIPVKAEQWPSLWSLRPPRSKLRSANHLQSMRASLVATNAISRRQNGPPL